MWNYITIIMFMVPDYLHLRCCVTVCCQCTFISFSLVALLPADEIEWGNESTLSNVYIFYVNAGSGQNDAVVKNAIINNRVHLKSIFHLLLSWIVPWNVKHCCYRHNNKQKKKLKFFFHRKQKQITRNTEKKIQFVF